MLVNPKQMILDAQRAGYAIGSFNTSDLEITKAIILAAEKLKAPVMVETSEKAIGYAGLEEIVAIITTQAKKARVPVALHLDHGSSLETVARCLQAGYTSVMFDGSKLSFSENIILTRRAAEMAKREKAACEGELGSIGKKNIASGFTNPNEVSEFAKKTDVDFLAVSFGSKHGVGENEKLDINLLKEIRRKTDTPLVLHGASGVSEENISMAIKNGICKINIDTDIRNTFSKVIREIGIKSQELQDPREIMTKVITEIQKVVEEKIRIFGSEGRAK